MESNKECIIFCTDKDVEKTSVDLFFKIHKGVINSKANVIIRVYDGDSDEPGKYTKLLNKLSIVVFKDFGENVIIKHFMLSGRKCITVEIYNNSNDDSYVVAITEGIMYPT